MPADAAKRKTRIIEDDWGPNWNEEFIFPLRIPELALLRIVVREHDMSDKDDFGGQTCLPVSELRPGIRAVPLYDKKGQKFKSVRLLMRFKFEWMKIQFPLRHNLCSLLFIYCTVDVEILDTERKKLVLLYGCFTSHLSLVTNSLVNINIFFCETLSIPFSKFVHDKFKKCWANELFESWLLTIDKHAFLMMISCFYKKISIGSFKKFSYCTLDFVAALSHVPFPFFFLNILWIISILSQYL